MYDDILCENVIGDGGDESLKNISSRGVSVMNVSLYVEWAWFRGRDDVRCGIS